MRRFVIAHGAAKDIASERRKDFVSSRKTKKNLRNDISDKNFDATGPIYFAHCRSDDFDWRPSQ